MRKALTSAFIESVKPTRLRAEYWDTHLRGFGLRVTEKGIKTFCCLYRHQGRLRRFTIGTYPTLSLKSARDEAKPILRAAQVGEDPASAKHQDREADTFGELAEVYLERHAKAQKRSWREDERALSRDLLPAWRNRKAAAIERRDVIAILDSIVERGAPILANRTRALVSKIYNFGIGRDIVSHNPAHLVPRPGVEHQRERVLTEAEIKTLWRALDTEPADLAAAMRLALLTAQRKSEVLGMTWAELDLDGGWWVIPAERAKNKLAHRVPLEPQTLTILRETRAAAKESPYVFPGGRKALPLLNLQKHMRQLKKHLKEADAGPNEFKFHDLRRTAASQMTAIGIGRVVVSKILNHVERSVTAVYDRHSYDAEKRAALKRWDRRLAEIVTKQPPQKVTPLRSYYKITDKNL
jgi:integrase